MNKKKINEIGEKLDVSVSSIEQGKNKRRITKPLYFLIQIAIFFVSSLVGMTLVTIKERYTYPMMFIFNSIPAIFFTLSVHAGNGIFSIPGQKRFGLSKNIRITTFFSNLLASLIMIKLFLDTATTPTYPTGTAPAYSVFKKSLKSF
ncbi:MAG: hypothetical protein ACXADY_24915 [Candidatus Hodarchaeales archaeon]